MTQIKICGLKTQEALDATIKAGADFAGFIFYEPSPRHLSIIQAQPLINHAKGRIQTVAVTVDADDAMLAEILALPFDAVQLHGHETVARVQEVRTKFPSVKIIKAFSVRNSDDIACAAGYGECVDYFLFDAKAPDTMLPGGNGLHFDWELLKHRQFSRPWFLAGGIHSANVAEAMSISGATMVDISSSVESSPGVKDSALIQQFVANVKAL